MMIEAFAHVSCCCCGSEQMKGASREALALPELDWILLNSANQFTIFLQLTAILAFVPARQNYFANCSWLVKTSQLVLFDTTSSVVAASAALGRRPCKPL